MGKGDQVRGHQGRVTRNFGWHSITAVSANGELVSVCVDDLIE